MKKFLTYSLAMLLIFSMLFALTSCGAKPNSDPDKAVEALKAANYEDVAKKDSRGYSYLKIDDLEWHVGGIRTVDGKCDWVEIYYFKDAAAADAAWDTLQEEANSWFEGANEADYGSAFVCKKSGNMVYYGTKNGVADAK